MRAVVTHIHLASHHAGRVLPVERVTAVAGKGLEGDCHFGTSRHVTLVCSGELAEAAAELGLERVTPGATRRNITVDLEALPRRHGATLRVGEVELAVWRDCTPCEVMDTSVGPGGQAALQNRAGVSATVVVGGVISVGDPVSVG